ncbi:hypothetical protein [uncultured Winogradskyella sp.]|uniref:hypothetical protein n=1 Tax=uncultured Winogradskyella sp. TaxID=395353 RepID=UPI00260894DE|nr:hypothetical protein [uncultured Winogradskyella sp.]
MKYLKITFIRIVLSFFGANMINALITANTSFESISVFFTIITMGLLYFALTFYVNNRS